MRISPAIAAVLANKPAPNNEAAIFAVNLLVMIFTPVVL
jgi:hypothetical protein